MPVADHESSAFPHRKNADGTFDSICPICFRTVASGMRESQLAELESPLQPARMELTRLGDLARRL
jgi:hypothetical protein